MSWVRIHLVVSILLLSACVSPLHIETAPTLSPEKARLSAKQQPYYWWQLRFRLTWPDNTEPDFSRHLLIAERILLPIITEHEDQLPLWRVHRRAGRDDAGHQLSFIFYTNALTASAIERQAQENELGLWLQEQGMIEKLAFHQRTAEEMGQLGQTSDPNWPAEIQESWPYFIMGASQTWLMLIQELSQEQPLEGEVTYRDLLQHYRTVDTKLNNQWREYGQHAYLHHLNAVFGYQPVRIKSSELKRF